MKLTCPLFNECGGCSFLDISSEEQLHLKENEMELLFSPVLEKHGARLHLPLKMSTRELCLLRIPIITGTKWSFLLVMR